MILFGNRATFHIPHSKQARYGKHVTSDRFSFPIHIPVVRTSQQIDGEVGNIFIEISNEVSIQLRLLLVILAEPSVWIGRIVNIMLVSCSIIIIISQAIFKFQEFKRIYKIRRSSDKRLRWYLFTFLFTVYKGFCDSPDSMNKAFR